MANRQYIGARYVPTFADPVEWDNSRSYEALTIVTHLGTSYTSKVPVPAGIAITDTSYWVETGNYNAQVELYRQQVQSLATQQTQQRSEITVLNNLYNDLNAAFHQVDETHADMSYLHGKKILILGDSISASSASSQYQTLQPNWVACLRDKVPEDCVIKNELSNPGRFITGNQGIADQIRHLTAEQLACDILIIFAGVNDYRYSRVLSNGTDNDYSTLKGSLKMIETDIYNKIPNADVFIISPLREFQNSLSPYPEGHKADQPLILYRNLLYAWACNNGFNFIDGFSAPMLNPARSAMIDLYQKDGLHPNATYAPLLCEYIYNKILTHTPVKPGKETVLIELTDGVETGVTATVCRGYADESGMLRIHAELLCELTSGSSKTLLTLSTQLSPGYKVVTLARCSSDSGIVVSPVFIDTDGSVKISAANSGNTAIAIDVEFPIGYLNPSLTPSV